MPILVDAPDVSPGVWIGPFPSATYQSVETLDGSANDTKLLFSRMPQGLCRKRTGAERRRQSQAAA